MTTYFEELAQVNVSGHTEKKGKFTYLSWPFAITELSKRHPDAEIEVRDWNGFPAVQGPNGWMVCVSVTIGGIKRSQWHPVLDTANKPIANPDVFQVNTSIQRAMVKAIALHGLGLYIYAGEDLPEPSAEQDAINADWLAAIASATDRPTLDRINADLKAKLKPVPPALVSAWKQRVAAVGAN